MFGYGLIGKFFSKSYANFSNNRVLNIAVYPFLRVFLGATATRIGFGYIQKNGGFKKMARAPRALACASSGR